MNRRSIFVSAALVGIAAGTLIVLAHDEHDAVQVSPFDLDSPRRPSAETLKVMQLETAEADFGSIENVLRLVGNVRVMPNRVQLVSSGVSGTVAEVRVQLGDRVRKGDVIAKIHSPELAKLVFEMHQTEVEHERAASEVLASRNTYENVKNSLAANEAQTKLLEDEVKRLETAGDAVSANLLSSKRAGLVQAKAQLATLKITYERSERTLNSMLRMEESTSKAIKSLQAVIDLIHGHPGGATTDPNAKDEDTGGTFLLYAHTDGLIRRRDALVGQGVEAGQVLLEIADYRTVMIDGELPESLAANLANARGLPVRVRRSSAGPADAAVTVGTITGLSPIVDGVKRTGHVLVTAENPGAADGLPALLDGSFVTLDVVFPESEKPTVVVPLGALVNDGPLHFVFVKEGDAYVKRDIVPGRSDDRFIEVVDGVVPGDQVVVRGAYALTQLRPSLPHDDHEHDHDHGHKH